MRQIITAIACGLAFGGAALGAPKDDIAPVLKQSVACMIEVLKTMPGVNAPVSGLSATDGWLHPYVRFEYPDELGQTYTARFEAQKPPASNPDGYWFMAVLPGLVDPRTGHSAEWGTHRVLQAWKTRCGINASVLSV